MKKYYDVVLITYTNDNHFAGFSAWGREWAESKEQAIKRVLKAYAEHRDNKAEVFYVAPTKICQCCNQVIEIEDEDWNTPENWEKSRRGRK